LIADRAYDSDKLRSSLWQKGWDLVCPHRRGRKRKATQDGRKLRRYRRRWKIERTIWWISQFRRLVVRYEHYSFIYQGFLHLACIMICLRKFETSTSVSSIRAVSTVKPSRASREGGTRITHLK